MKNHETQRIIMVAVIVLAAIVVMSGCTQKLQAEVLGEEMYCVEGERIIISLTDVDRL